MVIRMLTAETTKMDSMFLAIILTLVLHISTGATGTALATAKPSGEELPNNVPYPPNASPTFKRIEKVESSDADKYWEATVVPTPAPTPVTPTAAAPLTATPAFDFVDGNHPNSHVLTTHDHVDKDIGHVPPTKRVKKILPPFEGEQIETATTTTTGDSVSTKEKTEKPLEGTKVTMPSTTTTMDPLLANTVEVADGIQGIRLVPSEHDVTGNESDGQRQPDDEEEGGETEGDDFTMQKSIWDLLKEREQMTASDPSHMDAPESGKNESGTVEATSLAPELKSPYEHFDSDSQEVELEMENFNRGRSNIEKHELPLSYALSWLQLKDQEFRSSKKPDVGSRTKNDSWNRPISDLPQDVTKLLQLTQDSPDDSVGDVNGNTSDLTPDSKFRQKAGKWYLLLLTGNSTIVQLRQRDFTKYLKLNLAARLSVEYDDVRVNKVVLAPPRVLVNVSVFAPSEDVAEDSQLDVRDGFARKGESSLYKLADSNATLLELSGEEYHVVRFLSLDSDKPEAEAHRDGRLRSAGTRRRHSDLEFVLYTFLGSTCACALILTLLVTINKRCRRVSDLDWTRRLSSKSGPETGDWDKDDLDGASPAVIYSGGFPQIRGSWMTGPRSHVEDPSASTHHFRQECPTTGSSALPPPSQSVSTTISRDSSRKQSKLQIYSCDAESLVIPTARGDMSSTMVKPTRTYETHPLDVRIGPGKSDQDNPIFAN